MCIFLTIGAPGTCISIGFFRVIPDPTTVLSKIVVDMNSSKLFVGYLDNQLACIPVQPGNQKIFVYFWFDRGQYPLLPGGTLEWHDSIPCAAQIDVMSVARNVTWTHGRSSPAGTQPWRFSGMSSYFMEYPIATFHPAKARTPTRNKD